MRADYKYDVFGNRIEKAVDADGAGPGGTDTTRYAHDGWNPAKSSPIGNENWDIWADLDADDSNALEYRYLRGDIVDQVFARIDDAGTEAWYLTDRLGSVRKIVNDSGTVQHTLAYDGFGNASGDVTATTNANHRYFWTSREYDVETGLQYNRARYYDPSIGRWIRHS